MCVCHYHMIKLDHLCTLVMFTVFYFCLLLSYDNGTQVLQHFDPMGFIKYKWYARYRCDVYSILFIAIVKVYAIIPGDYLL